MAVRVRLRVEVRGTEGIRETCALVNTGFETEKPRLLIPLKLTEELGLWPKLPTSATVQVYGTAGGVTRVYVVPDALSVQITTKGFTTASVVCDAVISDIEKEVLISDKLGGRLGIIIEDIGEGLWRLRTDSSKEVRKSEPLQLWS